MDGIRLMKQILKILIIELLIIIVATNTYNQFPSHYTSKQSICDSRRRCLKRTTSALRNPRKWRLLMLLSRKISNSDHDTVPSLWKYISISSWKPPLALRAVIIIPHRKMANERCRCENREAWWVSIRNLRDIFFRYFIPLLHTPTTTYSRKWIKSHAHMYIWNMQHTHRDRLCCHHDANMHFHYDALMHDDGDCRDV